MLASSLLPLLLAATSSVDPGGLATATTAGPRATGTVTITGRVSQIASLSFYDHRQVGEGVTGHNAAADGSLDYKLDLGDLTQAAVKGVPMLGGSVTMILRSNTPYTLAAHAEAIGFVEGDRYLSLEDFGFAVPASAIQPSGRLATNRGTRLASAVDADLFAGQTAPFQTTLADVTQGLQILGGETISRKGTLTSAENGLLVTTQYAVRPQVFRSQPPFAVVVTYTMATP